MADETIFEFLHAEIINYVVDQNEIKNKDAKVHKRIKLTNTNLIIQTLL